MIRIAVTLPQIGPGEPRFVREILERGWDYVHLRHPGATLAEMRRLIEAVPQECHGRLRLHGHFELTNEFNLGGLHLNGRCPLAPRLYAGKLSRSCHSIEETRRFPETEYVTLSPIFDSISKAGYKGAFSQEQLKGLRARDHVVALGGICPQRIPRLAPYPFYGVALSGYLFSADDADTLIKRIQEIDNQINICFNS